MSVSFVGNAALIARINRSSILHLVKESGPISRATIAKRLDLNPATVGRCVGQLLEARFLIEAGPAASQGGRPATLVRYNHKAGMVIGLDLNGSYLLGVLADLDGEIIHRVERGPSPTRDPQQNLDTVYDIITALLDFDPAARQSVRAIGIAGSSVIVNPGGIVARSSILGWRNVPLKSLLETRFGYTTSVQNESDLGALAESIWGIGRNIERLVWLGVGLGIGSGIVIRGRLYQGAHQAAGEVGYMVPGVAYLGQVYETFGCMETLSSSAALVDRARAAINGGSSGLLGQTLASTGRLTAGDIFQAARQNDATALRLVDEMANYMSIIIVGVASVLDPDIIVLGQDLSAAHDLLLPRIESRIQGVVAAMPRIVPSSLTNDAIVQGAVALALQATDEQFYLNYSAFREALTF